MRRKNKFIYRLVLNQISRDGVRVWGEEALLFEYELLKCKIRKWFLNENSVLVFTSEELRLYKSRMNGTIRKT